MWLASYITKDQAIKWILVVVQFGTAFANPVTYSHFVNARKFCIVPSVPLIMAIWSICKDD